MVATRTGTVVVTSWGPSNWRKGQTLSGTSTYRLVAALWLHNSFGVTSKSLSVKPRILSHSTESPETNTVHKEWADGDARPDKASTHHRKCNYLEVDQKEPDFHLLGILTFLASLGHG